MDDMEYARQKNKVKPLALFLAMLVLSVGQLCFGAVITRLPTQKKIVAITFDACETQSPSYFDERILSTLLNEKIPFTLFVSGKFAKRNAGRLAEISKLDFVGVENHSLNHIQHMEALKEEEIIQELQENETVLKGITLKKTEFFRFPGGNYDEKTLKMVEHLGYRVVHWSFASGDADKNIPKERLYTRVVSKDKTRQYSHIPYQWTRLSHR